MPSLKASPRNSALGLLSDYLMKLRNVGDKAKIPFTDMGLGELLMGKTPEEVNEWAYGNSPLQVVGGGTGSYVPQLKQGRGQQVADTMLSAPGLGQLARATGRAAYQFPNSVKRAATDFMHVSAAANPSVIKRRGGVWKPNAGPELQVRNLLEDSNIGEYRPDRLALIRKELGDPLAGRNAEAIGKWAEGPFTTYLKKDFASPNDRIRQLADMGIKHKSMEDAWIPNHGDKSELLAQMGTTKAGRDWEDLADSAIWKRSAKEILGEDPAKFNKQMHGDGSRSNPETGEVLPKWMENIPGDEPIHEIHGIANSDIGFDHVIDTLMNSMQAGRLTPEQVMSKNFNIEAAVRHVHEANALAKKDAEKAVRAQLGALKPIKEYPEGYKWYELPDTTSDEAAMKLANTLGCEGGWCTKEQWAAENYGSGNNRLRVLIDPEGRAVTQMTVQAGRPAGSGTIDDMLVGNTRFSNQLQHTMSEAAKDHPEWANGMPSEQETIDFAIKNFPQERAVKDYLQIDFSPRSPEITEIKGRFNEMTKPEYHQYIQDQIRTGDFGKIASPEYAGMIDMGPFSGNSIRGYYTLDEALAEVHKLQDANMDKNYSGWIDELNGLKTDLGYDR